MKNIIFLLVLLIYTTAIFYVSSLSGEEIEQVPAFFLADKVLHILEYSLWGFLFTLFVGRKELTGHKVLIGMALGGIVGLFDELWQFLLQRGRNAELGDWLGDVVGTTLGIIAFYFIARLARGDKYYDARP
jgi:VanZ family protein